MHYYKNSVNHALILTFKLANYNIAIIIFIV